MFCCYCYNLLEVVSKNCVVNTIVRIKCTEGKETHLCNIFPTIIDYIFSFRHPTLWDIKTHRNYFMMSSIKKNQKGGIETLFRWSWKYWHRSVANVIFKQLVKFYRKFNKNNYGVFLCSQCRATVISRLRIVAYIDRGTRLPEPVNTYCNTRMCGVLFLLLSWTITARFYSSLKQTTPCVNKARLLTARLTRLEQEGRYRNRWSISILVTNILASEVAWSIL